MSGTLFGEKLSKQCENFAGMGKNVLFRRVIPLFIFLLIISQCACAHNGGAGYGPAEERSYGEDFLLMNTHCSITIYESGREEDITAALSYARELERELSRTEKDGELGILNASQGEIEVSENLAEVIGQALEYGDKTGGMFDITVGRLSELWNFSSPKAAVPDSSELEAALSTVDFSRLKLVREDGQEGGILLKPFADTVIDLGAIAKGYIADKAAAFLKARGVESAILNFGGNVVTIGEKGGGLPWIVAIKNPWSDFPRNDFEGSNPGTPHDSPDIGDFPEEPPGEFAVRTLSEFNDEPILMCLQVYGEKSVVTSGIYERKFVEDGVLYHHILNPKTGYPVETDIVSVTIIGDSSMECDALSTSCLVLGAADALGLIEDAKNFEAVLVLEDGRIVSTAETVLDF